jgi:hypothetical protein
MYRGMYAPQGHNFIRHRNRDVSQETQSTDKIYISKVYGDYTD